MSRLFVLVFAAVAVVFASSAHANAASPPQALPPGMTPAMFKQIMAPGPAHPTGIPADAVPYLGCIPTMGFHYANKKDWPFGPIYGWYKGKVTFTEIMVAKAAFENGTSWSNVLKPLPGHQVDHVDIWYEAHGHPGYEAPHYDIHAWYVPSSEYMYYCNNPSGKKPAWL
jgi:hypothetical protein